MCQAYEGESNYLISLERRISQNKAFEGGQEAALAGCPRSYVPSSCWEKEHWTKGWDYGTEHKEELLRKRKEEQEEARKLHVQRLTEEICRMNKILGIETQNEI